MKNTIKLFGIIAVVVIIGFSFASCGDTPGGNGGGGNGLPTTAGRLTINDIPAGTGRIVATVHHNGGDPSIAAVTFTENTVTGRVPTGNSVTLYVWAWAGTGNPASFTYTGDLHVIVFHYGGTDSTHWDTLQNLAAVIGNGNVTFANGVGTLNLSGGGGWYY